MMTRCYWVGFGIAAVGYLKLALLALLVDGHTFTRSDVREAGHAGLLMFVGVLVLLNCETQCLCLPKRREILPDCPDTKGPNEL
jgi:hypothetical protein